MEYNCIVLIQLKLAFNQLNVLILIIKTYYDSSSIGADETRRRTGKTASTDGYERT